MKQARISVQTNGQGLYEITQDVARFVAAQEISDIGLLTLFVRHTSCSLTIQENADPDVKLDLQEFFARLVPENMTWLRHTCEGPDDMPAHIKSALTQVSLNVPLAEGQLLLGTWQGLYLFEHRHQPHRREIVLHLSD